jgi:hypothetical protein
MWAAFVFAGVTLFVCALIFTWHKGSEAIDRALAELDFDDRGER